MASRPYTTLSAPSSRSQPTRGSEYSEYNSRTEQCSVTYVIDARRPWQTTTVAGDHHLGHHLISLRIQPAPRTLVKSCLPRMDRQSDDFFSSSFAFLLTARLGLDNAETATGRGLGLKVPHSGCLYRSRPRPRLRCTRKPGHPRPSFTM
jgi:hypothetical protein